MSKCERRQRKSHHSLFLFLSILFFLFFFLLLSRPRIFFFNPNEMDADTLRSLALRGGGFSTPRLNDSLQAHGAGLSGFFPSWSSSSPSETAAAGTENKESPLAAYRCLRSLNLADNGLESLKGMPRLEDLRCL